MLLKEYKSSNTCSSSRSSLLYGGMFYRKNSLSSFVEIYKKLQKVNVCPAVRPQQYLDRRIKNFLWKESGIMT